eukprot:2548149-Amphidinium_carterae.1
MMKAFVPVCVQKVFLSSGRNRQVALQLFPSSLTLWAGRVPQVVNGHHIHVERFKRNAVKCATWQTSRLSSHTRKRKWFGTVQPWLVKTRTPQNPKEFKETQNSHFLLQGGSPL